MNATQTQRPVEASQTTVTGARPRVHTSPTQETSCSCLRSDSQPSPRPETRTQSRRGRPWGPLSDSGEIATPYVGGTLVYMHSIRMVVG